MTGPQPYRPQPYRPNQPEPYDPRRHQVPYQPPPPPQVVYLPPPRPHRVVTTRPMGAGAEVFHWTMILCTGGLWVPVYLAAKRARKTITTWE